MRMGACAMRRVARAPSPSARLASAPLTGNSCRPHERSGRHRIGKAHPREPRHAQKPFLATCVGALALPLAACNDPGHRDRGAELWPFAQPAAAGTFVDPDGRYRHGQPLARRRQADRRQRHGGQRLRHRARPSAHGLCAAERRRAGRREQRAAEAGRRQGHQGLGRQAGAEMGGRGRAERQPHHAAARRRRRRRRRNAQRFPQRPEFAVRHGAGRRRFLCRQFRRDHEISLSRPATPKSTRPA